VLELDRRPGGGVVNPGRGEIIWEQIPLATKMACGAREPFIIDCGIEFRAGRSLRISVVLEPSDTYKVEAYRIKRGSYEKVILESIEQVYVDNLGEVIYRMVNK
jgi:hypothetical protein